AARTISQLVFVLLENHPDELAARAHPGLLKEALQDRLDIALGDLQPPGDLLVRKAFENEAQHLSLTIVEHRRRGVAARVDVLQRERLVQPYAAAHYRADACRQLR